MVHRLCIGHTGFVAVCTDFSCFLWALLVTEALGRLSIYTTAAYHIHNVHKAGQCANTGFASKWCRTIITNQLRWHGISRAHVWLLVILIMFTKSHMLKDCISMLCEMTRIFVWQVNFDAPCRTTNYPRQVPELPWYRHTPAQMVMAGLPSFPDSCSLQSQHAGALEGCHVSGVMHHQASCITRHASGVMHHHASCIIRRHASSGVMHQVSCIRCYVC